MVVNGWLKRIAAVVALSLITEVLVLAAEPAPPPEQAAFFEKEVRPLLARRCFKCHGNQEQKGGLRLDHPASILAGGDSGPALVRGKTDESLLVEAINYQSLEMPPDGKLSDAEIAVLTRWVQLGAPWPNADQAPSPGVGKITNEDRQWWAFQPLRSPEPPRIDDGGWSKTEIDRFLFQAMGDAGLQPAPEADRRTLIRRATFDLSGLCRRSFAAGL